MEPFEDSGEMTALGTFSPAKKLRFDVFGRVPHGYTVA
ncbi:unannotated protein [freshwater metagenome]|uniref:Unannotated protein n=1 Tax=freshwater metagenome TaxID=449393 RepID=A0A6J6EW01_9ZZZZ